MAAVPINSSSTAAPTSVVGLRIARELQLPLGTPVVLNNMTDRNIVDRVKVDGLTLGPSTIRNLELLRCGNGILAARA